MIHSSDRARIRSRQQRNAIKRTVVRHFAAEKLQDRGRQVNRAGDIDCAAGFDVRPDEDHRDAHVVAVNAAVGGEEHDVTAARVSQERDQVWNNVRVGLPARGGEPLAR